MIHNCSHTHSHSVGHDAGASLNAVIQNCTLTGNSATFFGALSNGPKGFAGGGAMYAVSISRAASTTDAVSQMNLVCVCVCV